MRLKRRRVAGQREGYQVKTAFTSSLLYCYGVCLHCCSQSGARCTQVWHVCEYDQRGFGLYTLNHGLKSKLTFNVFLSSSSSRT